LIAEVARLYYEEDLKLKEIGQKFKISSSSVSRLLKEAQELKIVEVVVRYPFLTIPSLGQQLQTHLGLKEAHVLPDVKNGDPELMERVGVLAARVLEEHLHDGMTLGISLGVAVASTANAFFTSRRIHCPVIRLQGANENEVMEGTNLAQIFAAQLGNEFKVVPSPWILKSRKACEILMEEPSVRDTIAEAEASNIALVGIGTMKASASTILRNKLISRKELDSLSAAGAVGEICGKYYDQSGNILDVEFSRRTVSINLEKLHQIETVIGVAAGQAKVDAIYGAACGRLINMLVTDATTARLLLDCPNIQQS
jgi:DNA-binding transcriptional regulator LsrR (DeoR family)